MNTLVHVSAKSCLLTKDRRALAALRFEEREEISRGIAVGRSIRQIAQGLGRAPSTVSREIRRNGGSQAYRANRADRRARERAFRLSPSRYFTYPMWLPFRLTKKAIHNSSKLLSLEAFARV
jgi:hypothetical protein